MTAEELLSKVTFVAATLDDVPHDHLRSTLEAEHIVRVRGLFSRDALRQVMLGIARRFDPGEDRKHDPRDVEVPRTNFQKLQIGANSGVGSKRTLGRVLRILYNPIFAPDVLGLREAFVRLARFRNGLYGLPLDHAVFATDDGFWSCTRLHQYPRGGGFMVPHRDRYAQTVTAEARLGYYQPLLVLSERGVDYDEGGAYIDIGEERVEFEAACQVGDVIVYDGSTVHGVADIDPLAPLDLQHFGGRVAAFASLYRHLVEGPAGYEALTRRSAQRFGDDGPPPGT